HFITAADPLPDDLRQAIAAIRNLTRGAIQLDKSRGSTSHGGERAVFAVSGTLQDGGDNRTYWPSDGTERARPGGREGCGRGDAPDLRRDRCRVRQAELGPGSASCRAA